ncbi:MAG: hypothetical protein HY975_00995 [Candidatus Kerfeldbacteria bacterium]|nr:hypothetical protein [Candidatus Kerfeldbacteria bacterium]
MKNLFGLVIVVFGLGLLLQQLNVPGAASITAIWWPLIIIGVGVIAWQSNRRAWFGPLLIILVGFVILLNQLDVFEDSAWNIFWPAVIILVGGRILMGKRWEGGPRSDTGPADASVLFSGVERKVTGPLAHSSVSAWFGGVKLDLREADIAADARLDVTAGFGGIDILVPRTVKIITKVTPFFGGAEDKSHPDAGVGKTLTISGTALFGGVSVKN